MSRRNIKFGVNYVPSKNWWYSWLDWDKNSIEEDLYSIASLGMDHIRIHCLWSVFQPNAAYVSEAALDKLQELLDLADQCNLDVQVTVFDGYLSGFTFYPPFYQSAMEGRKNIFIHADMLEAEKFLLTAMSDRIGKHPRFLGFDIGNELNCLQDFGEAFSIEQGDAWLKEMMVFCDVIAPGKLHVNGVDHRPWFMNSAFSREALSSLGSATSQHTWIEFTGASSRYDPMEPGCLHLAEYCLELAKAYSVDSNRQIWIQEFGATHEWMPREVIPDFAEKTIKNVLTCDNLWGVTWWCSHDIDRRFKGFFPLEYDLGLLDTKNRKKDVGNRIARVIEDFKRKPEPTVKRNVALVLSEEIFNEDGKTYVYPDNPGWKFAKEYMELVSKGMRPAIVREKNAENERYLKSRGIDKLIWIPK